MYRSILSILAFTLVLSVVQAQPAVKYNYAAQKKLLPAELGAVYLGMDLKAFAQKIKPDSAIANGDFEELRLELPFKKGNIEKVIVKFSGLSIEQKEALIRTVIVKEKTEYGENETEVKRINVKKLMAAGKLYEITVFYKKDYDLDKYVVTRYGKPNDVYKKGDDYHFFDKQWVKTSADKMLWLIRYNEETKSLMLAGRIDGSEWGLEEVR